MTVAAFLDALGSARPTPGGRRGGGRGGGGRRGAARHGGAAHHRSEGLRGPDRPHGRGGGPGRRGERAALLDLADRDAGRLRRGDGRLPPAPPVGRGAGGPRRGGAGGAHPGRRRCPWRSPAAPRLSSPPLASWSRPATPTPSPTPSPPATLLHAAVAGGLANVSINLAALTDTARTDAVRDEAARVRERAAATLAAWRPPSRHGSDGLDLTGSTPGHALAPGLRNRPQAPGSAVRTRASAVAVPSPPPPARPPGSRRRRGERPRCRGRW